MLQYTNLTKRSSKMSVVLDLPSQVEEMLSLIAKERNISQENLLKR